MSLERCSHLASEATPSIGRRRVACSCYAGAVFLARIAVLRRSGCSIALWDHFLGGFSLCFFPFTFRMRLCHPHNHNPQRIFVCLHHPHRRRSRSRPECRQEIIFAVKRSLQVLAR